MKAILTVAGVILGLALCAQETPKNGTEAPAKPKLSQDDLEAQFKATLTKATFNGRWCAVDEGKLGPEKKDRYTIVSASKLKGDAWLINARIQYGGTDLVAPIPVQVKWAGDTAVITVDNFAMPGSGTYSARVLVYNNTYAGTWSGEDHGGLMSGVIMPSKEDPNSVNTGK